MLYSATTLLQRVLRAFKRRYLFPYIAILQLQKTQRLYKLFSEWEKYTAQNVGKPSGNSRPLVKKAPPKAALSSEKQVGPMPNQSRAIPSQEVWNSHASLHLITKPSSHISSLSSSLLGQLLPCLQCSRHTVPGPCTLGRNSPWDAW